MLFKFIGFWALWKFYLTVLNLLQLALFTQSCLPDSFMWLYWAVVHTFHHLVTVYCGAVAQFIYPCCWRCTVSCCWVLSYRRAGLLYAFLGILGCLCKCFSNVNAWFIGLWKFNLIRLCCVVILNSLNFLPNFMKNESMQVWFKKKGSHRRAGRQEERREGERKENSSKLRPCLRPG